MAEEAAEEAAAAKAAAAATDSAASRPRLLGPARRRHGASQGMIAVGTIDELSTSRPLQRPACFMLAFCQPPPRRREDRGGRADPLLRCRASRLCGAGSLVLRRAAEPLDEPRLARLPKCHISRFGVGNLFIGLASASPEERAGLREHGRGTHVHVQSCGGVVSVEQKGWKCLPFFQIPSGIAPVRRVNAIRSSAGVLRCRGRWSRSNRLDLIQGSQVASGVLRIQRTPVDGLLSTRPPRRRWRSAQATETRTPC